MSILNMENDGMPYLVLVIFRTLLYEGSMAFDRLLQFVAPESVIPDAKRLRSAKLRWTQLGLFEEDESGNLSLARNLAVSKNKAMAEAELPNIMARLALNPQNNTNFWDAEKSASADFTRGVAWMLAQNVYTTVFVANHEAEDLENKQLAGSNRSLFQNNTRWTGFKSWAPFLGFGTLELVAGSKAFLIDPTIAVRNRLDEVFKNSSELPVSDFINRLAEQLPVVDRGRYRMEVESQLNRSNWEQPSDLEISTSLTRALFRLREARELRFDNRSDSAVRMNMRLQGGRLLEVTHILREGAHS